ncbi:HlyU family transcriptional regulator [Hoeflea sp. AS16]|uniref:HlyU family transcriptional regulator n=1 Tax=unclassified Hoeflea TaxID=2614931 RepID=UPI003172F815
MAGIMDSIRNLFGGKSASSPPQAANEPDTYKDCLIYSEPMAEGGQWRLAGRIVKGDGEAAKEHKFIRADIFSNRDDVEAAAFRKARQIIDEQGDALFSGR